MKKTTLLGLFPVFAMLLIHMDSAAYGEDKGMVPPVVSKELQKLKSLAGRWEGTSSEKENPGPVVIEFKVTSGGTAVVETLFPGTPHEMVSVYHDDHGKPHMTHYCMLGNQPDMALSSATAASLDFELSKNSGIKAATESHMHALNIAFSSDRSIVETWKFYENGKEQKESVFRLSRVQ